MSEAALKQDASPDRRVYANPEEAKLDWPKTPDGTIDWETVFEKPGTGLVPLVSSANNHDLLFKLTANVIQQLFTRKGDQAEVERFLHELTRIITAAEKASSTVESTRTAVIDLLRRIKQGRIDKAAAYVEAKKAEQSATGVAPKQLRRRTARRDDDRKIAVKKRIMLMGVGGSAAAVLIAGIVGVLIMMSSSDETASADAARQDQVAQTGAAQDQATAASRYAIEDSDSASLGRLPLPGDTQKLSRTDENQPENGLAFSAAGYPQGKLEKEDLPKLAEHVVTLEPILYARNVGGGASRKGFVLPVLSVRNPDSWKDICEWGPSITEAINFALAQQIPTSGTVSDEYFAYAGEVAAQLINQRLGSSVVDGVFILRNVDRRMTDARARCRLVEAG